MFRRKPPSIIVYRRQLKRSYAGTHLAVSKECEVLHQSTAEAAGDQRLGCQELPLTLFAEELEDVI